MDDSVAPPPIQIVAHPPERGRRRGVVLYGTCCCCCCCCCLHTLGGLIGALAGSTPSPGGAPPRLVPSPPPGALEEFRLGPLPPDGDDEHVSERPAPADAPLPSELITPAPPGEAPARAVDQPQEFGHVGARRAMSGTALYWLTVLLLTPPACVAAAIYAGSWRRPEMGVGVLLVLFLGLPAVQLAASVVAALLVLAGPPGQREARWGQIARITGYSLIGAAAGIVIMAVFCFPFLLN